MRIALAQLNQSVGDIEGNARRVADAIGRAAAEGAHVVATPELALTGYPPEDLLLKSSFVEANRRALDDVARRAGGVLAVVGFVDRDDEFLYNAAALCHSGRVVAVYRKHLLPNYGVFDERRYFQPGHDHLLVDAGAAILGVTVCEDAWDERGPIVAQGRAGAGIVLSINASPFHKGKLQERADMLGERARQAGSAIVYVNLVGGQDELVFDGGSLAVGGDGEIVARLPQFEESFAVVDVVPAASGPTATEHVRRVSLEFGDEGAARPETPMAATLSAEAEVYSALRLALADYVRKNGFERVALGLSGGIDSSLSAAIAVDALGSDRVVGVAMPSEFSTSHSVTDAKELASNLGMEMLEIPIATIYDSYLDMLQAGFGSAESGGAEENLQARIRGNLLMFISNRYGHLVLATGNKSESACGYATLYGDMAGGFSLIRDVFKVEVYALARYRNSISPVIPANILTKAPSAELRHDQRDEDTLPPYPVLDPILEAYVEEGVGIDDIVARGFERETVAEVITLVDRAEYKRRQAPPGPKVTVKAFGRDRRLPISNAWREARVRPSPRVVGEEGPE